MIGSVDVEDHVATGRQPKTEHILLGSGAGGVDRHELAPAADLMRERKTRGGVACGDAVSPMRLVVQGDAGERDEPGDRDRRPHQVEQRDAGGPAGEICCSGDRVQRRVVTGTDQVGPHLTYQPGRPAVQLPAGAQGP
ncbi:hypothetical protein [Jiangella muralis]|uniref:hypothetical protein n=1 Tax=Jiangella muralis TaxID=702383 RepID=UPI001F0AB73F|nr:hypothetical protein [Jiangella muralis]